MGTTDPTAAWLQRWLGAHVYVPLGRQKKANPDAEARCKVVDAKVLYGRPCVLVKPCDGRGERWVQLEPGEQPP